MYILLSDNHIVYRVDTTELAPRGEQTARAVIDSELRLPRPQEIEQNTYLQIAANAAYAALNPLDWVNRFYCELTLSANDEKRISFDQDSSSVGLGYGLAIALEWRKQLNKHTEYDAHVFATGALHSSGAVGSIEYIETKINAACNFMQSQEVSEQGRAPFVVYYPLVDDQAISQDLKHRVLSLNGQLRPVNRLQQALVHLLGDHYDGESAGRWHPFKGLASFDYKDSLRFFGRERALADLVRDYDGNGLFVITGTSGSGKSSLIKAGLLPYLYQRHVHQAQALESDKQVLFGWGVTSPKQAENVLSILDSLFAGLASMFKQSIDARALSKLALSSPEQCAELLQQSLPIKQFNAAYVFYIDQFEELYNDPNLDTDEAYKLNTALDTLGVQVSCLSVIVSFRKGSDFELKTSGPTKLVDARIYANEWREIIGKQATSFGLSFEKGLEDALVNEACVLQHALPALEYLLEQMYDRLIAQDNKATELRYEDYTALNGIRGVIASRAESVIKQYPEEGHAFFEYFVGLNNENYAVSRSVDLDEIAQNNPKLFALISAFIEAQLVVDCSTSHAKRVKLAHDTLLSMQSSTAWASLKSWFEDNQDYLQWLNAISGNMNRWLNIQASMKDQPASKSTINTTSDSFLLNPHDLELGAKYKRANKLQQTHVEQYYQASKKYYALQKSKKRRTTVLYSMVFVSIITIFVFIVNDKDTLAKKNSRLVEQEKQRSFELLNQVATIQNSIELTLKGEFMTLIAGLGLYVEDEVVIKNTDAVRAIIRNKSLSLAQKQTALDLLVNEIASDPQILMDLSKENLSFDESLVREMPELHRFILETDSMDADDKQYWLDILPSMTDSQVARLFTILQTEKTKLEQLEEKYVNEIRMLNQRHLSDWRDFQAKSNNTPVPIASIKEQLIQAEALATEDTEESLKIALTILQEEGTIDADEQLTMESENTSWASIGALELLAKGSARSGLHDKAVLYYTFELALRERLSVELDEDKLASKYWRIATSYEFTGDYASAATFASLAKAEKEWTEINLAKLAANQSAYALLLNQTDDAKQYAFESLTAYPEQVYLRNSIGTDDSAVSLKFARSAISLYQALSEEYPEYKFKLKSTLGNLWGSMSYYSLFSDTPEDAINAAITGLRLAPEQTWIKTNLAHGYMLTNNAEKALYTYKYNGELKVNDTTLFKQAVLQDFIDLENAGITHPLMTKIRETYQGE